MRSYIVYVTSTLTPSLLIRSSPPLAWREAIEFANKLNDSGQSAHVLPA